MNAVWCLSAMQHFGRLLASVLDWPLYIDAPVGDDVECVYIIGMYDAPDYDWTLENTKRASRRVIHWCGSDVAALHRPEMLPEATHLCETQGLAAELLGKGVHAKVVTFPTTCHVQPLPLPAEPVVTFYMGSNPVKYGAGVVRFLTDAMPEIRLVTYSLGQYTREEMEGVIARSRVHVRFTDHDGSANSVREHLEAGRRVVATCDLPFVKRVSKENPVEVVRAVRAALKHPEPDYDAAEHYLGFNSPDRFLAEFKEAIA